MERGLGVVEQDSKRVLTALNPALLPGEKPVFAATTGAVTLAVVTNYRVMALNVNAEAVTSELPFLGHVSVQVGEVRAVNGRTGAVTVSIEGAPRFHAEYLFPEDAERIAHWVEELTQTPLPRDAQQALREIEKAKAEALARANRVESSRWPHTEVVGGHISQTASRAVANVCREGEYPWLMVVSPVGGGLLAAFEDRVAIVKGGAQSPLGGAMSGGAHAEVFGFADIRAIEYQGGLMTGVLEVVTDSYAGTGNRDYWHGSGSASADPTAPPNTLSLGKVTYDACAPQLAHLREMVAEFSEPSEAYLQLRPPAQPAPVPLASQLSQLAALLKAGHLSREEFVAAKAQLMRTQAPTR